MFSSEVGLPLEVKRDDSKVMKMKISPDIEVCDANHNITYTYQWLIFDGNLIAQLTTGNL